MNNALQGKGTEYTNSDDSRNAPNASNALSAGNSLSGGGNFVGPGEALRLMAKGGWRLFHDKTRRAFATIPHGSGEITFELQSAGFSAWLKSHCYFVHGVPLSDNVVEQVVATATNIAVYERSEQEVFVGVGSLEKDGERKLYLDLRRNDLSVVEITRDGWEVVPKAPVPLLRLDGAVGLPLPTRGGSLKDIYSFANVKAEDLVLIAAYLLGMLNPEGTRPILFLHGSSGTGKSTAAKYLKSILDPHTALLQKCPKSERDLFVAALNNAVVVYDNLSGRMPQWMSDAFCRIATGTSTQERQLYTNLGSTHATARAGVIITSIDDVVSREDLVQRTLKVNLTPIAYQSERKIKEAFEAAHPGILGKLLNAAVVGLRNLDSVQNDESWNRPRLADLAEWIVACEPALPFPEGSFMETLRAKQRNLEIDLLEDNEVFLGLRALMESVSVGTTLTHTATSLREALGGHVRKSVRTSQQVSRDLNRNGKIYERELGIEIVKDGSRDSETNCKLIKITKLTAEEETGDEELEGSPA